MPQRTIYILPALRREAPWLALMVAALLASSGLAHLLIAHDLILPSLSSSGGAPPWAWAALYAPELVAALMIGWRLRSWPLVLLYAGAAAAVREGFHLLLRALGDRAEGAVSAGTELAIALPLTVAAYAIVFRLAASSREAGAGLHPATSAPADRAQRGPGSGIVQR